MVEDAVTAQLAAACSLTTVGTDCAESRALHAWRVLRRNGGCRDFVRPQGGWRLGLSGLASLWNRESVDSRARDPQRGTSESSAVSPGQAVTCSNPEGALLAGMKAHWPIPH